MSFSRPQSTTSSGLHCPRVVHFLGGWTTAAAKTKKRGNEIFQQRITVSGCESNRVKQQKARWWPLKLDEIHRYQAKPSQWQTGLFLPNRHS